MIVFKDVTKTYKDGTNALQDVNLTINDGEFVFVIGASGAGKSTLVKLLMCEEAVSSGKILINAEDISLLKHNQIPFLRRKMGIVFQDFRLISNMTVYDNIAFAMRAVGKSIKEIRSRVPKILDLVELTAKARNFPNQLSGGEKQRVAFARALVNSPNIIIADEPTGNIDPQKSHDIMALLSGISERGNITVLVVTHEKTLVDRFNKRVITISEGKVISDRMGGYSWEDTQFE